MGSFLKLSYFFLFLMAIFIERDAYGNRGSYINRGGKLNSELHSSETIIQKATDKLSHILQEYGPSLEVLAIDEIDKKNECLKKVILQKAKQWKKESWWEWIWGIFFSRNEYDAYPFSNYDRYLSLSIIELVNCLKKLELIQESDKKESLVKDAKIAIDHFLQVHELIIAHDRYLFEGDKRELYLEILRYR